MRRRFIFLLSIGLVVGLFSMFSCGEKRSPAELTPNTLSPQEKKEGWQLLFDGESFHGWRGLGRDSIPGGHWIIEDGCIKKVKSEDVPLQADGQPLVGGDLMTIATFEKFELSFEWRISSGGNSGVKYNVSEEMSVAHPPRYAALGFEYQILNDENHPDAQVATHRAAALYDLIPASNKHLNPVGEFNQARIVFTGRHGEHWLNGRKVLQYDLGTPEMDSLLSISKYHIYPNFASPRKGHIVLQDHTDEVWFRNIKIRILNQ